MHYILNTTLNRLCTINFVGLPPSYAECWGRRPLNRPGAPSLVPKNKMAKKTTGGATQSKAPCNAKMASVASSAPTAGTTEPDYDPLTFDAPKKEDEEAPPFMRREKMAGAPCLMAAKRLTPPRR
ncbi:unnamed protein product [Linum trigynum]|uniref:Uncharacterized protein n=1 Tax=Linum trigynum TaxID=586398 RepID=A0AAV2D9F2_9ROSI